MSAPRASAVKTLGALGLLTLALPVSLTLTGLAAALGALTRRTSALHEAPGPTAEPLTVMVSGGKMTKALQLCRSFHAAGHRVVLVESEKYRLTGHRFSRSVDAFHTIAGAGDYAETLLAIVEAEDVDVYVPVCAPATALPDARAKALLETRCRVLHLDPDQVELLDDKHAFARAAAELGLSVPDTHLVTDPQQVLDFDFTGRPRPYILKSIAYDPVHRLDLTRLPFGPSRAEQEAMGEFVRTRPISPANPWILQEFIEGPELCTHGTVRDGRLRVYLCCESSAFQVNYEMVDRPRVRAWVERFVGALALTGEVSFDFIEAADGTPYAIECNPRTHSAITMLYDHPGVAAAYLEESCEIDDRGSGGTGDDRVVVPTATSRPTYWLYHEAWRLLAGPCRGAALRTIVSGTDAILERDDPLPFLLVHHLQIPALLLANLRRRGAWIRIDFNIGKLVEPAGD